MGEIALFGFTKDQLSPIVDSVAGTSVQDFTIRLDHSRAGLNGICGEYLVPTILCRTEGGDSYEFTLFVRRRKDTQPGRRQAPHYSVLSEHGVPVPRLYGVLEDSQGREVLFLELLDEVTVSDDTFYQDTDAFVQFLAIAARLNAVKPTTDYAAEIGRAMAGRGGYTRNWNTWLPWSIHVLDRIEEYAGRSLLDEQLGRFCLSRRAEIRTLKRIALELIRVIPRLPVGLVHGDFHPGNTGWRRKPRELAVFDFEDMMFDTRFYDVAVVLGGPEPGNPGRARQTDLAEAYLNVYSQSGRSAPSLDDFLREISVVWFARKLNLWEHLPEDLSGPGHVPQATWDTREARLDSLYRTMSMLVGAADNVVNLIRNP